MLFLYLWKPTTAKLLSGDAIFGFWSE